MTSSVSSINSLKSLGLTVHKILMRKLKQLVSSWTFQVSVVLNLLIIIVAHRITDSLTTTETRGFPAGFL